MCPIGYLFTATVNNSKPEILEVGLGNRNCQESVCSTITGTFKADEKNYISAELYMCMDKSLCDKNINGTDSFNDVINFVAISFVDPMYMGNIPNFKEEFTKEGAGMSKATYDKLRGPTKVTCCDEDLCNGDAEKIFKKSGNTEPERPENDNSTKTERENSDVPKKEDSNRPKKEDSNKPKKGNSNESEITKYSVESVMSIIFLSLFLMIK
uniref:Uncharacterized protein n=1 Tax=Strongyloides papillosus TaxID=174720 RepID=A0A0N5BJI1_STREA